MAATVFPVLSSQVLKMSYMGSIKSFLAGNIMAWFGNATEKDRKVLSRVVCSAEGTTKCPLPALQDIYAELYRTRSRRIVKDTRHPDHGLFSVMQLGKRYRCLRPKTERLRKKLLPSGGPWTKQGHFSRTSPTNHFIMHAPDPGYTCTKGYPCWHNELECS